jgi:hypothetical protein
MDVTNATKLRNLSKSKAVINWLVLIHQQT